MSRVASGETPAKAAVKGHNDFIPWKRGISLQKKMKK